jgi:colicin import membrane protein
MWIPRLPESLLVLLLAAPVVALAAPADGAAAQRERIARERATIERDTRTAQANCASQFAVTACVDRVKSERRQRLQALDRQSAVLDDELRKRRAAERVERLRQRQAAQANEPPKVTIRSRSAPASDVAASAGPPRMPQASTETRRAAASRADADAAARAAATARRASDAAAHRRAVEKRNLERAEQRPPAKPLPSPVAPPSAASR